MNFIDPTGHSKCTPEDQKAGDCNPRDDAKETTVENITNLTVQRNFEAAKTNEERFVALVPAFQLAEKRTGISWQIHAAQWALESGWGQFMPIDVNTGMLSNNFFGVKGVGPRGSVMAWTRDIVGGKEVYRLQPFAAYATVVDSIVGHSELLMTDYYAPVRQCGLNAECAGRLLGSQSTGGLNYSDEPDYWGLLKGVIDTFMPWLKRNE